jgi:hypothetical protein
MLFRIEAVPFYRGEKPIEGKFRWIEALAVLPASIEADRSIRNLLLCRTDAGLRRLEERQVWEAIEKGQFRVARRVAARGF